MADKELQAMQKTLEVLSDLDDDEQLRVLDWLRVKLGLSVPPSKDPTGHGGVGGQPAARTQVGAKQFITSKQPATDVERITCLAYYLTHSRSTPQFKTKDLTQLNTEAAQPRFANAAKTVSNATVFNQFLTPAGQGRKQITARGESLVEALPGREAVLAALEANPLRGRKKVRKGSNPKVSVTTP